MRGAVLLRFNAEGSAREALPRANPMITLVQSRRPFLRTAGDRRREVDILLAIEAANLLDGRQLGERKIGPADGYVSLAKIFTRIHVARIDGERLLIIAHAGIDIAHLSLGVADHGEHHRVVLVANGAEGGERVLIIAGNRKVASLLVEIRIVHRACANADLLSLVVDPATFADGRAHACAAAATGPAGSQATAAGATATATADRHHRPPPATSATATSATAGTAAGAAATGTAATGAAATPTTTTAAAAPPLAAKVGAVAPSATSAPAAMSERVRRLALAKPGNMCFMVGSRVVVPSPKHESARFYSPAMIGSHHDAVRTGLRACLPRLWRYGVVLSGSRDVASDLVQATCVRALERAHQFAPGTQLDRWLFTILHSIWLNDVRAARYRRGQGLVDAETALVFDGIADIETNILAGQVLRRVQSLPEVQRETVHLVYVEGLTYREAAEVLGVPIGTIMSRLAGARARLADLKHDRGDTVPDVDR